MINSNDPCLQLPTPPEIVFHYDRRLAAQYAIEHSYDTAVIHTALQNNGRTSQRIDADMPYAYFRYSDVGGSQPSDSSVNRTESNSLCSRKLMDR